MPPAVVSKPGDDGLLPLDMRPMLPSDSAYFRSHPLMVPVEGVMPKELTDTYHQARSGGRIHMATDIMAMRGTPVLAAANGRIIKLANSGAGGITIHPIGSGSSWTKAAGNAGAGLEYRFARWGLRAEARDYLYQFDRYGYRHTQNQVAWQGGLTLSF